MSLILGKEFMPVGHPAQVGMQLVVRQSGLAIVLYSLRMRLSVPCDLAVHKPFTEF
jgi:hypothetical protein